MGRDRHFNSREDLAEKPFVQYKRIAFHVLLVYLKDNELFI